MTKVQQLENTLLELGTEIYRLKSEMHDIRETQEKFVKSIRSLQTLFEEKGMVSADEFESAVELVELMNHVNAQSPDPSYDRIFEKFKKLGH